MLLLSQGEPKAVADRGSDRTLWRRVDKHDRVQQATTTNNSSSTTTENNTLLSGVRVRTWPCMRKQPSPAKQTTSRSGCRILAATAAGRP